ncbi:Neutral protease 2 [Colletotrichum higginsianum IMI 349063]|uniref:deuterolysin n=1 Tax=Colletotrichum higginsianum (strain IMI 349063) TaxID=759273 RepID=A0A1B7XU97_COLHI|nr:Neutral protease 2 [Colletotrichum higginsianum IMI 349063]OBR03352.1 Neutral protease 2 [Colletotrichum higginsianum IMI 349063]
MAKAAYTAANTAAYYFTTWFVPLTTLEGCLFSLLTLTALSRFISTSNEAKVRTIYNSVANVQTTSPKISCTDTYSDCTDGSALLYTVPSANVIVPCPNNGFWDFPELAPQCSGDDYDRAGSMLHEMTHLYGTTDWAYGPTAAKALSATKAAANADTYEMYAESVRLGGCTTG